MKYFNRMGLVALCLAFGLALSSTGHATEKNINFSYVSVGEKDLKPIQVFDDGSQTFIQMKGTVVPAIFAVTGNTEVMLQAKRAGEFIVVPAIAKELQMRFGSLSAKVTFTGGGRGVAQLRPDAVLRPEGVALTSPGALVAPPQFASTVYGASKPSIGDAFNETFTEREDLVSFSKGKSDLSKQAAAKLLRSLVGSGVVHKVVITGRDDDSYVEGLAKARGIAIRDRVLAAGVPLDRIVLKEGISRDGDNKTVNSDIALLWKVAAPALVQTAQYTQPAAPLRSNKWIMARSDQFVSQMLSKWAASEGVNLFWKTPQDIAITGEATIMADSLAEAVKVVVDGSNKLGYPITYEFNGKTLTIK